MKVKTIKQILQRKMDYWLETIENIDLREQVSKNTIVTGGCIASMLLNEDVNDFDIYFKDKDTTKKVAQYYVDRFKIKNKGDIDIRISVQDFEDRISIVVKSAGIASEEGSEKDYQYFESRPEGESELYVSDVMNDPEGIQNVYEDTEKKVLEQKEDDDKPKYRPVFLSTNAITLSNKIQIITRFFGKPEEIHENYDFVHCTNYYKSWDDEIVVNKEALESLLTKELRYVGSKYPICSLIRIRKFIQRGWTINAGQILKAVMQISKLDLTDVKVLQDQLIGVDVAYFYQLVEKLKEKDPEKVNHAYLIEIIDRMF